MCIRDGLLRTLQIVLEKDGGDMQCEAGRSRARALGDGELQRDPAVPPLRVAHDVPALDGQLRPVP